MSLAEFPGTPFQASRYRIKAGGDRGQSLSTIMIRYIRAVNSFFSQALTAGSLFPRGAMLAAKRHGVRIGVITEGLAKGEEAETHRINTPLAHVAGKCRLNHSISLSHRSRCCLGSPG